MCFKATSIPEGIKNGHEKIIVVSSNFIKSPNIETKFSTKNVISLCHDFRK